MYSSPFVLVLMLINVAFSATGKYKYMKLKDDDIPLKSLGNEKMNKKPQELKDDDIPPNSVGSKKMNEKPQEFGKTSTQTIEVLGDEKMDIKKPQEPNKTPIQILRALGSSKFDPETDNLNVINQEALEACILLQKNYKYIIADLRESVIAIVIKNFYNYNTNVDLIVLKKLLMVLMDPELSSRTIRRLLDFDSTFIIFFLSVYKYNPKNNYNFDHFANENMCINRDFFIFSDHAYSTIQRMIGSGEYLSSERQLNSLSNIIQSHSFHQYYIYNIGK